MARRKPRFSTEVLILLLACSLAGIAIGFALPWLTYYQVAQQGNMPRPQQVSAGIALSRVVIVSSGISFCLVLFLLVLKSLGRKRSGLGESLVSSTKAEGGGY